MQSRNTFWLHISLNFGKKLHGVTITNIDHDAIDSFNYIIGSGQKAHFPFYRASVLHKAGNFILEQKLRVL